MAPVFCKLRQALIPRGLLPVAVSLNFDGRVLLFCLGASSVVAILYVPRAGVARDRWVADPGTGGRWTLDHGLGLETSTSPRDQRGGRRGAAAVRRGAVAAHTAGVLERVDPGTRSSDLLTMVVAGGSPSTPNTPEGMRRNYEAFAAEVEKVPGIRSIAWGSSLPFDGVWYLQAFQIDGDPPRSPGERDNAGYFIVSPSGFRLLGLPLLDGRMLADSDIAGAPQVCLVDEEFVRRYLRAATRWVRASRLTRWSSHHEW